MSVQEIQAAIIKLPLEQLAQLATWFEEYQARVWDQQIEEDLAEGRLDTILAKVDAEYEAGLAQPL
jgi:hypothetical protein